MEKLCRTISGGEDIKYASKKIKKHCFLLIGIYVLFLSSDSSGINVLPLNK